MMLKSNDAVLFLLFLYIVTEADTATTTCFKGITTKALPSDHVYHKARKPVIIGYRGSILKHQENTLEGMKDLVERKFGGMHMEVQMTDDEQIILFGDDSLKRLTGVDVATSIATYKHIKDMNLKSSIVYGNKTLKYKKTAKIPLLEDVLNAVKGKGLLIYIELKPSHAPPSGPADRWRGLRTGIVVGKLIRKLGMENDVFIVSADPFKLLAINHENSATVTGWWVKKSFYGASVAQRIRKEFVDLNGLRTCYVDTAPKDVAFIPFLLETGIVTKSVNGSFFDADFELINNPTYLSGRSHKTATLVKSSYNPRISVGAFLSYYNKDGSSSPTANENKIQAVINTGVDRIITDDVDELYKILYSVSANANAIIIHTSLLIMSLFSTLLCTNMI